MIKFSKLFFIILITFLLSNVILSINVKSCKDIVAVGDATEGNYNLLLKVRDPSRPGLQVLCMIPKGYEYTYNHPWTGKPLDFKVEHKFIGVATKGDAIPNIVKPGMALSDYGIAFGDADTDSNWKNPTRNAWDDFDWIRYACEKADNEDEAVELMTKDVVDQMHATGVSENLFIVGPKKGFVIEADVFHYDIKKIDDILVMSNYPKELWKTQRHKKLPIASSFEIKKEEYVKKGRILRLNSLFGIKIVDIGEDWIIARQVPFLKINKMIRIMGNRVTIKLGERETVGDYSVKLLDIDGKKAKVSVSYVFKAWEDKMLEYIQSEYGSINVKHMINWSRLHEEDLEGLRPMCEDLFPYESVMIYKIPEKNYNLLSCGWFSANHACSSIYIPVHICDTEIFDAYETGESAELSLELLDVYGHDILTSAFGKVEDVFLNETDQHEEIANNLIENTIEISECLTILDISMQEQAGLTEQMWLEVGKISQQNKKQEIIEIINNIWEKNYSVSLMMMANAINSLTNISQPEIIEKIVDIALNIGESRLNAAESIGKDMSAISEEFKTGKKLIQTGYYKLGFNHLQTAFKHSDIRLKGQELSELGGTDTDKNGNSKLEFIVFLIVILCIVIIAVLIKMKFNK